MGQKEKEKEKEKAKEGGRQSPNPWKGEIGRAHV